MFSSFCFTGLLVFFCDFVIKCNCCSFECHFCTITNSSAYTTVWLINDRSIVFWIILRVSDEPWNDCLSVQFRFNFPQFFAKLHLLFSWDNFEFLNAYSRYIFDKNSNDSFCTRIVFVVLCMTSSTLNGKWGLVSIQLSFKILKPM